MIFPDWGTAPDTAPEEALPLFREWAVDWENGCFALRRGEPYLVSGDEALKIWVTRALRPESQRFRYTAWSADYGNELTLLLGGCVDQGILESQVRQYVRTRCWRVPTSGRWTGSPSRRRGAGWRPGSPCTPSMRSLPRKRRFRSDDQGRNAAAADSRLHRPRQRRRGHLCRRRAPCLRRWNGAALEHGDRRTGTAGLCVLRCGGVAHRRVRRPGVRPQGGGDGRGTARPDAGGAGRHPRPPATPTTTPRGADRRRTSCG